MIIFQGHCNPLALSSLSHLFVRQISQIRLVSSSTCSVDKTITNLNVRNGRDWNQSFAEVGAERALSQASAGLLLAPTPSPPPHPLWGKPSRVGRSVCRGGFCTGCHCHFLWLQLTRLNVSKRGFENWGRRSKRCMERGLVLVGRIWKAIRSIFFFFALDSLLIKSSLEPKHPTNIFLINSFATLIVYICTFETINQSEQQG